MKKIKIYIKRTQWPTSKVGRGGLWDVDWNRHGGQAYCSSHNYPSNWEYGSKLTSCQRMCYLLWDMVKYDNSLAKIAFAFSACYGLCNVHFIKTRDISVRVCKDINVVAGCSNNKYQCLPNVCHKWITYVNGHWDIFMC